VNLVGVIVVLAVIGVVAAVVVGAVRGDLAEPASSLPPSGLPEGDLTTDDLEAVRFSLGFRGYRMDEVDEVLERVTAELARRDAELARRDAELARRDAELVELRSRQPADAPDEQGATQDPPPATNGTGHPAGSPNGATAASVGQPSGWSGPERG
jgi:DivIVA domain-containing protein